MKEKIITIKTKGITQKQWSVFLLELNLMKRAWKPYGVDVEIKAPGLKNVINWGTKKYGTDNSDRRVVSFSSRRKRNVQGLNFSKKAGLTCFDLCDILRLKLTTYYDEINRHVMNDGSGDFFGCICR